MDAEEASPTAEELELKEFNDPFEVVSETFVRQRRQEVDAEPISKEDDDLLTQMLDAMPIEDSLIHDAFSKMVNMNLVSSEIATQVQEDFDFEKLDFTAAPALTATQMQQVNEMTDELELEEILALWESGLDEEGAPLSETRIAEFEERVLHLDALIRRRKKAAFDKNR